jgi:hypothetical protein
MYNKNIYSELFFEDSFEKENVTPQMLDNLRGEILTALGESHYQYDIDDIRSKCDRIIDDIFNRSNKLNKTHNKETDNVCVSVTEDYIELVVGILPNGKCTTHKFTIDQFNNLKSTYASKDIINIISKYISPEQNFDAEFIYEKAKTKIEDFILNSERYMHIITNQNSDTISIPRIIIGKTSKGVDVISDTTIDEAISNTKTEFVSKIERYTNNVLIEEGTVLYNPYLIWESLNTIDK